MDSSMKENINQSEIDKLEKVLFNFKDDWEIKQKAKASKWRLYFLISVFVVVILVVILPKLWWMGIIVIGYFAGSLYSMLRLNTKTSLQIIEHQKQLKLVRLLRKFQASPYSEE